MEIDELLKKGFTAKLTRPAKTAILEKSKEKVDLEIAISEWDFVSRRHIDEDITQWRTCICHHKIRDVVTIRNRLNGNILEVGAKCADRFLDFPHKARIDLRKIDREHKAVVTEPLLKYAYYRNFLSQKECNAYIPTMKHPIYALDEHDARVRAAINARLVEATIHDDDGEGGGLRYKRLTEKDEEETIPGKKTIGDIKDLPRYPLKEYNLQFNRYIDDDELPNMDVVRLAYKNRWITVFNKAFYEGIWLKHVDKTEDSEATYSIGLYPSQQRRLMKYNTIINTGLRSLFKDGNRWLRMQTERQIKDAVNRANVLKDILKLPELEEPEEPEACFEIFIKEIDKLLDDFGGNDWYQPLQSPKKKILKPVVQVVDYNCTVDAWL